MFSSEHVFFLNYQIKLYPQYSFLLSKQAGVLSMGPAMPGSAKLPTLKRRKDSISYCLY